MEYIGIDVHKTESQICLVTKEGEILEQRIQTRPERFREVLGIRPPGRILVEASLRGCIRAAALCAALVSGRDLLQRLRREDQPIAEARELFEASQESDFFTLIRAFRFAQKNAFNVESCRRYGIHAQTARQVEQTYGQLIAIAEQLLKIRQIDRRRDNKDLTDAGRHQRAERIVHHRLVEDRQQLL